MTDREEAQDGQETSPTEVSAPGRSGRIIQPLTVLLFLSLLAAAIYSNTFSASFHFDDQPNFIENPWIKNLSNFRDLSGSRYVGFLTFALNYQFGGLSLFGYHLVNLLIHITNGFLVYLLVRLLFRASHTPPLTPHALRLPAGQAGLTTAPWIALASALLFVAHPIQTQAVTYIVQRFASLAALFYLLAVVCYLKWRLSPLTPHASRLTAPSLWYAAALIATLLAMKTKENTFTLPFMLLLIEAVFWAPHLRKQWIGLIPFWLTLPIIPLSRPGALGEGEAGFARDITDLSRLDYLFTQFRVIVTYLRLLIFPVHQNLDYDYPVYHSLFDPPVFFSFLFLSALFALAIYLLLSSRLTPHASRLFTPSASRLTAFGILWFFLTLSIESSLIPIRDVIFEHRIYLPGVGFFLAVTVAALGYADRWRLWGAVGIGILVAVFSVVTHQRNKVWQDELTLWTDVVHKSPRKARGYNNLGAAYANQKRWEESLQQYKIAITLRPNYVDAFNNLGNAYKELGQLDEAIQAYRTALALNPNYVVAHNNLGMFYYDQGKLSEALIEFEKALQLKSDDAIAYNNRGNVYKKLGRLNEALGEYKKALALDPDFAEAHNNLGVVLGELERFNEAIGQYRAALALKADNTEAHNNLGVVYKKLGRLEEAVQEYQSVLKLDDYNVEAHNNLGVAYNKLGRLDEAIREFKKALTLKPDHAEIHNNLGNAYQKKGRPDEALREYQTALNLRPDYPQAYYNRGLIYYERGKFSEAIEAFKTALRFQPEYAESHNNLGVVYKETGRLKEAIQEFQTALKLKPALAEAYYNLGDSFQRLGQIREAIPAFEGALKIKPDYEEARKALDSLRR